MKRNLRIVLMFALVVLMLGITMLVVSADPAPADTDYFQVTDATGAHVGYYETPAAAMAAVTADNYTVKLLKDIDLGKGLASGDALALGVSHVYTFDGNGHVMTFKELKTAARVNGMKITAGNVTLKGFTIKTSEAIKNLVYFTATETTASLTFENMTLEGGKIQILWDKNGNMTFKGAGNIVGKDNDATAASAISLKNNSKDGTLLIEGGQFIARSPLFEAAGATIDIRDGTFSNASGSSFFLMQDNNFVSAVKISGGTFTQTSGGSVFKYSGKGDSVGFAANGNAVINISGGRFTHYGTGNLFDISVQSVADKSTAGGTMFSVTANGGTTGYPVVKITDGGTATDTRLLNEDGTAATVKLPLFDGWPDEADWAPGAWKSSQVGMGIGTINSDIFYVNNSVVHLDISGGTYIGSPYTQSLIETAPQNATYIAEINITGGSFIGSRAWIRTYNASVWNIGGTSDFSKPAPQTFALDLGQYDMMNGVMMDVSPIMLHPGSGRTFKLDAASQGKATKNVLDENGNVVYETDADGNRVPKTETAKDGTVVSYNREAAGRLNITGGTFTVEKGGTCLVGAAGADIYITGGTFNIGCRGFRMRDDNMISYVYVSGGTFNGSGNYEMFYYSGSNGYKSESEQGVKYGQRGLLEITGGTFNTTGKCTAISYEAAFAKRPTVGDLYDGYIHISNGTFISNGVYLIHLTSGMAGELLISGGTFEGTAPRLIALAGYKGPFTITGGTFRLSALAAGATPSPTDAIIYIKTTSSTPVLNIQNGTFINDREGADRLILFDSKTATLNLIGGKFMTRYDAGSYVERHMNHNNMHVNPDLGTKETVEGVEYDVAMVYAPSNVNAPTMEADVTIRLNSDTPGIRFTSYMSVEKIAALRAAGATALAYGTLIAPREYLMQITDFTDVHGQLKAIAAAAGVAESKVFADVAASAGTEMDIDGNVTFRAALVNISDVNKGYGAISYVKVTSADGDAYYYSGFNVGSNLATLKTVVVRELLDVNDKSEIVDYGKYVYKYGSINDDGFSRFTQAEQNFMRRLVAGR